MLMFKVTCLFNAKESAAFELSLPRLAQVNQIDIPYLICQTFHTNWKILVLDSLFGLFIQKINSLYIYHSKKIVLM